MAKVLVACEYSGIVRDAFSKLGHDAWSIDILPTESPGQHIQDDVLNHLDKGWDLMIAHPPCTYLCITGLCWMHHPQDKHLDKKLRRPHPNFPNRKQQQEDALEFVRKLMDAPIEKICIENPVSIISSQIRKPNQYIQPYQFGHYECKKTGLWLKNLPTLAHTSDLKKETYALPKKLRWKNLWTSPSAKRGKERSKFYQGFADAMAEQWGGNLKEVDNPNISTYGYKAFFK